MTDERGADRRPVDTLRPPHEPTVTPSRSWPLWVLLIGGPALWLTHFMVVYLAVEAVCTPDRVGAEQPWSGSTLGWFIAVATVVFALICVILAASAWRSRSAMDDSLLRGTAIALSTGSAIGILVVGLPTLVVGTC